MKFPKLKPLCCGLLTASLSLTLSCSTFAFSDTSGHWGSPYINTAVEAGLMSGTGSNTFSPDKSLTYGEIAVVIVNGAFGGNSIAKSTDAHWGDQYLNVLLNNKMFQTSKGTKLIVYSTPARSWQDAPITRRDLAAIISRLMDSNYPLGTSDDISVFTDITVDDSFYIDDVARVYNAGIMTGLSTTEFGGSEPLTRGAFAVVLNKLLDKGIISPTGEGTYNSESNTSTGGTTTTAPSTGTGSTTTPSTSNPTITTGTYNTSIYTVPADTNKDGVVTEEEVRAKLAELKALYPTTAPNGVNGLIRKTHNGGNYEELYYYEPQLRFHNYGCSAWAFWVNAQVFGNLPLRKTTEYTIGDILFGYHKSVVVDIVQVLSPQYGLLSSVYTTDGTMGYENVSWGDLPTTRTIEKTDAAIAEGTLEVYTRYPA